MKLKLYFLALLVIFSSCEDEKVPVPEPEVNYLKMTLQPTFGASDLNLDETFTTAEGYKVQFTDLKCYFTSIKNGSIELCRSALYDYRTNGILVFNKEGDKSDFNTLTGFLGVDGSYNHNDPTEFANDDPLNIAIANDMHWGWNPGYIFMKVEAKVDTIVDAIDNFDHFVIFHVGADSFIQSFNFTDINWIANGPNNNTFPLKLDLEKFLQNGSQTIDLKTEFSSHSAAGQEALSLKVIQNFNAAISPY